MPADEQTVLRRANIAVQFYAIYETLKLLSLVTATTTDDITQDSTAFSIVFNIIALSIVLMLLKNFYTVVKGPVLHPFLNAFYHSIEPPRSGHMTIPTGEEQRTANRYVCYATEFSVQQIAYVSLLLQSIQASVVSIKVILPIYTLIQLIKSLIIHTLAQWEGAGDYFQLRSVNSILNFSRYVPVPFILDFASLITRLSSLIEPTIVGLGITVALSTAMPLSAALFLAIVIALPEVIFQRAVDMDLAARFYNGALDYSVWLKAIRLPVHLVASASLLTMRALRLNPLYVLGVCKVIAEGFMGYNVGIMFDTQIFQRISSNTISTAIFATLFTVASTLQGYMKYIAAQERRIPKFLPKEENAPLVDTGERVAGIVNYTYDFFTRYDIAQSKTEKLKALVNESNRDYTATATSTAPVPA